MPHPCEWRVLMPEHRAIGCDVHPQGPEQRPHVQHAESPQVTRGDPRGQGRARQLVHPSQEALGSPPFRRPTAPGDAHEQLVQGTPATSERHIEIQGEGCTSPIDPPVETAPMHVRARLPQRDVPAHAPSAMKPPGQRLPCTSLRTQGGPRPEHLLVIGRQPFGEPGILPAHRGKQQVEEFVRRHPVACHVLRRGVPAHP